MYEVWVQINGKIPSALFVVVVVLVTNGIGLGQIGSGLLPDSTKPLPEPMLTSHQWGFDIPQVTLYTTELHTTLQHTTKLHRCVQLSGVLKGCV